MMLVAKLIEFSGPLYRLDSISSDNVLFESLLNNDIFFFFFFFFFLKEMRGQGFLD
jgi:hypothetical protein